MNLDTLCYKLTNIVLFWCCIGNAYTLSSIVITFNNWNLFHKPVFFVCQLEDRKLQKSAVLWTQQPLQAVINKKKPRWAKTNCIHSRNSATGCLYTTAQIKLVMHYILFSMQTNKASDFYNKISKTTVIGFNLNSPPDLRLN